MLHLMQVLWDRLLHYWRIGNDWTRVLLAVIFAWPFVLMVFAMVLGLISLIPFLGWVPRSALTALVALLPLLPYTFLLILYPLATGIAWNTDEGKWLIRVLSAIVGTELLIGI